MSPEKRSSATTSDEATLPPPKAGASAAPPADETGGNLHGQATLAAPPGQAATLSLPAAPSPAPPVQATPSDATLDPSDPRAQAFREAALKAAKGPVVATGASFGHYELIEPIAKGGMGIVYKARQRDLNRIVAIKMILAGQFADREDIDRFYAEAEAAAALRHPNIVAIYEIGEVQGQHFFSMDYIDGQSLAGLVQESPLAPRRGAEMVRIIAETMQYAHDSGIVHRDLKPSNVLLDKKQRPLITDFGLAKHVTNQSQLTMAGSVIGTPSYMPPEQAAGKGDQVGPWSDLYSLGAILYEVLTGRPPFRAASPFETIRQVLETEPVSPRLVNPNVPRDLETICLKCLQKERSRRYASTQELADELGRFLRGEPIQARPISQVARFWRLCRRNPITSSAIAAAALMLVAASGVSTVAYFETSAALGQSQASLRDAMAAVKDLFTEVSENTLLNQPGMQPLRNKLLGKARDYYEGFLKQRANNPRIQDELAGAYYRLGQITEILESPEDAVASYRMAREMQERLLALRPNDVSRLDALGNTLNAMGTFSAKVKDYDASRREFGEAVRIRAKLAAAHADNSEYQRALANTYMNIGMAEYNAGRPAEARLQFEEAQTIRLAALQRDPQHAKLRRDLAKGYYNLGNLDLAEGGNEGGNPQAETHLKAAVAEFEKLAESKTADLDNLDNAMRLAVCYRVLGDVISDDRADERRRCYQQALERLGPLAQQNPAVVEYQREQAGLLLNLFDLELKAGNSSPARAALERAREILLPLARRFPDDPWYQRDLAVTLRELAKVQDAAGDAKAAALNLQEAIRILKALVEQKPHEAEYLEELEATKAVVLSANSR